ncbi:MAG: hypothetical protein CVU73_02530 [Deltaproteobacteria bacterium HGW-Deltaproteobacteria-8]|jgi:uncharacterized protein YjbI with pentapeptide repeats|nr:MAG: hypothetical protein CVU73_02530 [Deltaproteobacteria bacterium HGW-Deltaproteobacteria-8]
MKIFKEKQHSFFPRPFGIRDALYLSVGVMAFIDLNDPGTLLTEQELWKTLPGELGPKPVMDQGIPKPRGEVLVTGSCHAPRGQMRPASQVRVRVGEVDKKLSVYGDRYWKNGLITEAEPFVEMPIVWPNAYGGEGFAKNPLGKGIHKLPMPDGSMLVPLPNLELPAQQIGSPGQSPDPAGFGPLDLMWPQRLGKSGTYDEKWKNERWPYFPDDMNYEFFNMACADQFATGYFEGGEAVTIENMHPDLPVIQTTLPRLRMRCFVTLNTQFKPHTFPAGPLPSHQISETDEFREVTTQLETVWLFPSIMRGLLIYRGSTRIMDEENGDVLRVLIRHEQQSEAPKPIEHYRDLQIQLLDRGVGVDMSAAEAAFDDAMQKAQASMVKIKNIPKFVDAIRQKALGNRPTMPMAEPEEVLAKSKAMLAEQSALLDRLETMAKGMLAKHGHMIAFDTSIFDRFRAKIAEIGNTVEQSTAKLSATKQKLETTRAAMIKELTGKLKAVKPEHLAKAGVDPDAMLPPGFPFSKKGKPWHDRGFPFVVGCRKALAEDRATQSALKELGFQSATIHAAWLGVNTDARYDAPSDWGLKDQDVPAPEGVLLPTGLVLPRFDGPVLNRIACRTAQPEAGAVAAGADHVVVGPDHVIPGSTATALFLPAATLIDLPSMPAAQGAPVVCVADDLQALFMEQEVGDCCSVLSMPAPDTKLDKNAAEALKKAQTVLVVRPAGFSSRIELREDWGAWKQVLPTAEPLELKHGATVFQARSKDADIRQWVFDHLPKTHAQEHSVALGKPAPGKPPSEDFLKGFKPVFPDVMALTKGVHAEVKQAMEAKFAPMQAEGATLLGKLRAIATEYAAKYPDSGIDPAQITVEATGAPRTTYAEVGQKVSTAIRRHADNLRAQNHLTPELATRMETQAASAERMGTEGEAKYTALATKMEAKKLELAGGLKKLKAMEPPEQAKAKLLEYGLDPDAIRPLTREQVQRMHEQGKPLAGAILSGVDLSGLDLTDADLSGCRLSGTLFTNTRLDGARLVQAMADKADFTKASLKGAVLERGMFGKALFRESDLTGSKARQAIFRESDFSGATLADADFDMTILEKTDFTRANLTGARINMCMVSGKADKADFQSARITKSLFKGSSLDNADFRKASVNQSLFNGAKGKKVNFAGANLDKLRSGGNTEFPGADFTDATLRGAGLRDTDLTGSTFLGADLESAMIENSQLVDTNFNGASAKRARFTKSNLEGASMRAANLFMGGLRKTRLVNTDLRGSNLFAVDFYKSVVGKTRFEGANLKKSQLHDRLDLLEKDE